MVLETSPLISPIKFSEALHSMRYRDSHFEVLLVLPVRYFSSETSARIGKVEARCIRNTIRGSRGWVLQTPAPVCQNTSVVPKSHFRNRAYLYLRSHLFSA